MTESVKDPRALVVTSQSQMLDKLQVSEVTHVWWCEKCRDLFTMNHFFCFFRIWCCLCSVSVYLESSWGHTERIERVFREETVVFPKVLFVNLTAGSVCSLWICKTVCGLRRHCLFWRFSSFSSCLQASMDLLFQ